MDILDTRVDGVLSDLVGADTVEEFLVRLGMTEEEVSRTMDEILDTIKAIETTSSTDMEVAAKVAKTIKPDATVRDVLLLKALIALVMTNRQIIGDEPADDVTKLAELLMPDDDEMLIVTVQPNIGVTTAVKARVEDLFKVFAMFGEVAHVFGQPWAAFDGPAEFTINIWGGEGDADREGDSED